MAIDDFTGSIAQTKISFTTTPVIETVNGDNFYKPVIFIQNSDTADNIVAGAQAVGTTIVIDPFTYTTVAKGTLLTWLQSFYFGNTNTAVYLQVYDGATHDIATQYNLAVNKGYFKILFFTSESAQYKSDVTALAGLCSGQKALSQAWINSSDSTFLTTPSSGTLAATLIASGYDCMFGYSASAAGNPLLVDLGLGLSTINFTGTPVGNKLDYMGSLGTLPSSGVAATNLTSTQKTNLEAVNVAYYNTDGNGTGSVSLIGRKSLLGNVASAQWVVAYVNYMCQVNVATMLNQVSGMTYKNEDTYRTILAILNSILAPFVKMGRLSNLTITAPEFADLPVTNGETITVPRAWSADFNDRVGAVNVQGYLFITL